jgi:hypothetical protein
MGRGVKRSPGCGGTGQVDERKVRCCLWTDRADETVGVLPPSHDVRPGENCRRPPPTCCDHATDSPYYMKTGRAAARRQPCDAQRVTLAPIFSRPKHGACVLPVHDVYAEIRCVRRRVSAPTAGGDRNPRSRISPRSGSVSNFSSPPKSCSASRRRFPTSFSRASSYSDSSASMAAHGVTSAHVISSPLDSLLR